MIYTVTCNPSLDYIVSVDGFRTGKVNRTTEEILCPGGKGLNVSMVLRNLGYESIALGFIAGFTGREIVRMVAERGITEEFIEIPQGLSRINVKLRSDAESEINGKGPVIGASELEALYAKLDRLGDDDILVLAGSIPASMPQTAYADLIGRLRAAGKKTKIVVDATNHLLVNVLQYKPFLIKPNNHELGEIYGVQLRTGAEVVPYARRLAEQGAQNVLVSMAGEGAVLVTADGAVYESAAPQGKVRNSVGAGDSMVAGFLAGYLETSDVREAFYMGLAAGSASAFSDALATREETMQLMQQLRARVL